MEFAGTKRYDRRKEAGAITPRPSASTSRWRALGVLDPCLALESKVPSVALALELVVIQKDSIVGLGAYVEQHLRVLLPPAAG